MVDGTGRDERAAGTAAARRPGLIRSMAHRLAGDHPALPVEGRLAPFTGATRWLNSEPLTPEGLRGRVVLVDFWTYTCVNWLRTLPYRRAWAAKYADAGLTVVGVHTPEFGFEHDVDAVAAQCRELAVDHPVAIDNDYAVWRAFANHYWPAVYVADAGGRVRHHHFGEGEYAMTEMALQRLLLAAGADVDEDLVMVEPRGLEVAADWPSVGSPETYLGYRQSTGFASERLARYDRPHLYSAAPRLPLNHWDLTGTWTVGPSDARSDDAGARLAFEFRARDVNLVMGPAPGSGPVRFRVRLDGRAAQGATGTDVAADGSGTVAEQRCYQLIRQAGPVEQRRFEIEFLDAGAEAFCFTFG